MVERMISSPFRIQNLSAENSAGNLEQFHICSLSMTLSMAQPMTEIIGSESRRQRYSALAREYYEPVYCFIARQISNQADAADLTQQVFVKGFQSFVFNMPFLVNPACRWD